MTIPGLAGRVLEQVDGSASMAERYLERYPTDWLIWAYYGDTLCGLGSFSLARTALHTARGLVDGDDATAVVHRFMQRVECQEAANCFAEALTIDPAYEEARQSLEDVRRAIDFEKESPCG